MKKCLFLFALTFASLHTFAQYPETSERLYFTKSKTEWVEVADFTNGITNDSIFGITFNGKKYQRIDLNTTSFNAQSLMIRADGTDMSSRLNRLFDNQRVSEIVIDQQDGGDIGLVGDIDLKGKILRFNGSNKFKRLSGNPDVKNGIIIAPPNAQIADTLISFSNIKTGDGNFYPTWLGSKADGATNDIRFWQKSADVAADNNLLFTVPPGVHFLYGALNLKKRGSIVSQPGAKINIREGTQFLVSDSVLIKDNDIEVTASGSNNSIIYRAASGDTAYGVKITGNKIQAHRRGSIAIALRKVSGALVENNWIDSSNNKGIEIGDASDVNINRNHVTNSGRSGICLASNIRRAYVRHNYGKGSAQNLNLNDGIFDIYGPNVETVVFEGNYAEASGPSYNSNLLHICFRFQGFKGLTAFNNTAVSNSDYLVYAFRFGNRDSYISEDVDAFNNKIYIKGKYGSIISIQGVKNVKFTDYLIDLDSATATPTTSSYAFRVATEPGLLDTVQYLNLTGGTIRSFNKNFYFLYNTAVINSIDMSGTDIFGMKDGLIPASTTYNINSLKWVGGRLRSTISGTSNSIYITNVIRSIQLMGLSVENSNSDNMWSLASGYDGTAIIQGNVVNGKRARESGGGWYGTAGITNSSATINYPDSAGVLYTTRTNGSQTVTLPTASYWKGRFAVVVSRNPNDYYTLVNGSDTLRNKESGIYHSDGVTWQMINSNRSGTAPVGVINDNAITYAKIQQASGLSVIGRNVNSTGNISEIIAATAGQILYRSGNSLVFGKPDLVTGISTTLSGYLKGTGSSFSSVQSIPFSDISGIPDVYFKNSNTTGDSLLYMDFDTLKAKRLDVTGINSIVRTRTVSGDKILYSFQLSGDAASPGSNKLYGTNSSGVKGWYDVPGEGPGGGVSSVGLQLGSTGSDANVSGSPITGSGTFILNLPTANAAARGLLSSADWTTFNNKVNGSTTVKINGTSYNLTQSREWNVGTVTSVGLTVGSTGSDVNVSNSPVSVSGNLNINIPTASSTARGVLNTADWIAFNAKAASSINMIAGAGLIGGGTLAANRTFALGTPGTITSTSTNSTSADSHTHALDNTGVAAGTYSNATFTVDAKGRLTNATSGGAVAQVSEGEYIPTFVFEAPSLGSALHDSLIIAGSMYKASAPMASLKDVPWATISSVDTFYYTRIGSKVHVFGRMWLSTNNDLITGQIVGISLPPSLGTVFSDFGQLRGNGYAIKSGSDPVMVVTNGGLAGAANYASFSFTKGLSGGLFEVSVTFDYIIRD